MKIGIITVQDEWLLRNYGSLFQLYALQAVLKQGGHEPFLIRRRLNNWKWTPTRFMRRMAEVLRNPVRYVKGKLWLRRQTAYSALAANCFQDFFASRIQATPCQYGEDELMAAPPAADCYLCGSDQVWTGAIPSSFLLFAEGEKRVAYAASCDWGKTDGEWQTLARRALPGIRALSVREEIGADICRRLLSPDSPHPVVAADPVLLLGEDEWGSLAGGEEPGGRYLLVYAVGLESRESICWQEILRYARRRGLEVKAIAIQGSQDVLPCEYAIRPTPQEFLHLFRHAECVATNSFHGAAFSILFHKPFWAFKRTGEADSQNARFDTLLRRLELENRLQSRGREPDLSLLSRPPAASAYARLEAWRQQSVRFLQQSLP